MRQPLLLISLALALTACVGGRSPAPDYHMLTARAQPASAAPASTRSGATRSGATRSGATRSGATRSIGVGPVQVAQFLARPSIVTHDGGGSLSIDEQQRWGEPLAQGMQRVLLQNIANLTGAQVRNFPWRQSTIPDYAVRIDVLDLDRLPDGSALLVANWIVEDPRQGQLLVSRRERLSQPVSGGYDALTDAYSRLLDELSQRIVAALPR